MSYDATLYRVVFTGSACNDYGLLVPKGVTMARFGASIPGRRAQLQQTIRESKEMPLVRKLSAFVELGDFADDVDNQCRNNPFVEPLDIGSTVGCSVSSSASSSAGTSVDKDTSFKSENIETELESSRSSTSVSSSIPLSKPLSATTSLPPSPLKILVDTQNLLPHTPTKKKGTGLDYHLVSPTKTNDDDWDLDSPTQLKESPTKARTRSSPSKVSKLCHSLSNSSKKFALLQKPVQSGGLSLLERIKQKEKLRNFENDLHLPEQTYRKRILSKLPPLYDVIFELASSDDAFKPSFKCFSLPKLVSMVKDSFTLNISEQEVEDALQEISQALPDRMEIITQGSIRAIKVYPLDRTADKAKISEIMKIA